jgi:hypothetical protein
MILLLAFVGINALIWFGWTREITDPQRNAGDLLRIGYIVGHVSQRHNVDDLPKRHIKAEDYHGQPVDVVTIGDSFSIGGGKGRNSYYQDYMASLQGLTILNVPSDLGKGTGDAAPITTLSKLVNSGYLDVIKPKYLLLESVERLAIQRLTKDFSLQTSTTIEEINRSFRELHSDEKRAKKAFLDFRFINNGNWKFIGNNLQYKFRDEAHNSMVLISKLNQKFFTSDHGDRLIFYRDDIKNCKLSTPATVAEANRNLNSLAAILKAKGITLVFMPIVNKLNLYEPYLQQHRYPQSTFFEEMRKLPKNYLFIDTKEILAQPLKRGEQDIYFQDDSHWNWKASETIFSTVKIAELSHARK